MGESEMQQRDWSSSFNFKNLQWLDLSSNNLRGSLLENASNLFHVNGLQRLNLADNDFNGTISSKFFSQSVSLTHLDLSFNGLFDLISRFDGQGFDTLATNLTKLRNLALNGVDMSDVALTSFLNLSSSLEHLSLSYSQLQGEFPTQVSQLPNLKVLDLSEDENLTAGPLPITILNLTKIAHLDLSNNHLEGPFPNHVSELQFLEVLELYKNSISGGVPSWLFSLPSLPLLDLSYNKLVGPIDRIQQPSSIQDVKLSYNNIGGSIRCSIFDLVNLTSLDLSSNNLSGPIPYSIFDLVYLSYLDLSSNNLSSVIKSDMLSKLTSLEVLDVSRQFPNFFQSSQLEVLDLSNNMISGGISRWEAEGWEGLQYLDLSHNFLTALEQYPGNNLDYLNLHSNLLQGPILSTCLNPQIPILKELEVLIISKNKLIGNTPSSICNLSSLGVLDLSEINLSGIIPDCLGNLNHLQLFDLQMNNFIGKIPNSFVNNELAHLVFNDNQLDGLVQPSMANWSNKGGFVEL
ncbi:receptor-like protein 36 [Gossypium hirsutum]|uniref:Receptor-like protein 36 n=1 Tax=Gossypium hirsutum TaxID=3635 RepID=A0ABM3AK22_GOSHI|nr:receptor-like protein 36 [Gossypium hirsutum]